MAELFTHEYTTSISDRVHMTADDAISHAFERWHRTHPRPARTYVYRIPSEGMPAEETVLVAVIEPQPRHPSTQGPAELKVTWREPRPAAPAVPPKGTVAYARYVERLREQADG